MSMRSHGLFVGKSRHLSRHHMPSRLTISKLVKDLKVGDTVSIVPKGTFNDIPNPRYRGKVGKIVEKRGSAYVVKIKLSNATSRFIVVGQRDVEQIKR
ncbi:MAG: hypothetical protein ACP5K9_01460 [Candidatus Micrarchaeia archaeon]